MASHQVYQVDDSPLAALRDLETRTAFALTSLDEKNRDRQVRLAGLLDRVLSKDADLQGPRSAFPIIDTLSREGFDEEAISRISDLYAIFLTALRLVGEGKTIPNEQKEEARQAGREILNLLDLVV